MSNDVPPRVRALDAILRVAQHQPEFRIRDVLAEADLPKSKRKTVSRALHDLKALGRIKQRSEGSPIWESNIVVDLGGVETGGQLRILHCFADRGVEAEALSTYGEVIRVGINARDTNASIPIKADARTLPIQDGVTFDLGVFHPPCSRWSDMTSISGDPEDHPNYIPRSRYLGEKYCDEWLIENKPGAPLRDPVKLSGKMFGIPLAYERAFETSFDVDMPPVQQPLDNECSPYFYSDRSREWWASAKGYTGPYTKTALAKNAVPAAYIHWLVRQYLAATNHAGRDGKVVEGHGAKSASAD